MTKNTKSTKNAEAAVNVNAEAAITAFEAVLIKAVKAGVLKGAAIDAAIVKAGFAFTLEEHAACKPVSAAEQAAAELAAYGIDASALQAEAANVGALAVNVPDIAKALGKYGKHCFATDTDNGTSLVTHSIAKQLVETGKATLAKTLDDARAYLPQYSSTGHFNTCKRLLKAEYALNIWQGGFSITSK